MDTKVIYLLILSVAFSGLVWQLAGFSSVVGAGPGDSLKTSDDLRRQAENSTLKQGIGGERGQSDDNLLGLAISGIGALFSFLGMVVNLPGELINLGLPAWLARPIGYLSYIVVSIGLIQFASGRVFN